jgi:hypothetical protein
MGNISSLGYKITSDPHYFDVKNGITAEVRPQIEKCYIMAYDGEKSAIDKIQALTEKYPDCPQFMNYLSVAYNNIGQIERSSEVNDKIIEKYPHYLFGRLNRAGEFLEKNEFDKIPEILGQEMEIKCLYPERDVFHIDEVTSFLKIAIYYFGYTGNVKFAKNRFELLMKLAPDSITAEDAKEFLCRLGFLEYDEDVVHIDHFFSNFHHPEIQKLYQVGLYIEKEALDTILALPRETLIADLELVLQDSIDRFYWFKDEEELLGAREEAASFVIHALFILGELKAEEGLPAILNVLKQNEDYFKFYLGEFLTEAIWEPLYKVAENQLDALKEFMFEPAIYTYSKTAIGQTVEQIVWHQPDRRGELIGWFQQVFERYANSDIESAIFDPDVTGSLICEVININAVELLPVIKKLYECNYVNAGYCGSYNSVEKSVVKQVSFRRQKELLPIAERYQNITSTWAGYNNASRASSIEPLPSFNYENEQTYVRDEKKIGRNEPCTCGSGKKYKKCCLLKLN